MLGAILNLDQTFLHLGIVHGPLECGHPLDDGVRIADLDSGIPDEGILSSEAATHHGLSTGWVSEIERVKIPIEGSHKCRIDVGIDVVVRNDAGDALVDHGHVCENEFGGYDQIYLVVLGVDLHTDLAWLDDLLGDDELDQEHGFLHGLRYRFPDQVVGADADRQHVFGVDIEVLLERGSIIGWLSPDLISLGSETLGLGRERYLLDSCAVDGRDVATIEKPTIGNRIKVADIPLGTRLNDALVHGYDSEERLPKPGHPNTKATSV